MIEYSSSNIFILVSSIIIGFLLGVLYEFFRFIRSLGFKKFYQVFIQDIVFTLISGLLIFIFTFWVNQGVMRSYELLGILLGFIIYYFTFGSLIFRFYSLIIKLTCKFFVFLYNNTLRRMHITLDKFYKSGKIFIERKISRSIETRLYKNALDGFKKF